jgi:hypothetical protein
VLCRNDHPEVGGTYCIAAIIGEDAYIHVARDVWIEMLQEPDIVVVYRDCEECKAKAQR